jgi:hydroxyquinol 1,2-dioxygenase
MRPAHIHFRIVADGYEMLTTHVFVADDPFLDTDAVFGVKESLVAPFVTSDDAHCTLEYNFVLAKEPQWPRSGVKPRPSSARDKS